MNTKHNTIKSIVTAIALVAGTAGAGVPLNGLQGNGGIAFNPLAYLAGTYDSGTNVVDWISNPQAGIWYVDLSDSSINWYAAGLSFSVAKRVELSYGYGLIDLDGHQINTHNVGAKVKVLDENFGGNAWVPALAVGGVWKNTDGATDFDDSGVEGYVVATKLITQTPIPVLLSGGLLYSDEVVNGVLGHNEYDTVFFGNIDVLPVANVAVGFEYKQGVDASDDTTTFANSDYYDAHVAWFVDSSLTLVAAYADTGSEKKGASDFGLGDALVLSAQYAF